MSDKINADTPVNEATDASIRESFMYAQLAIRGVDTNSIGTPLTAKLSSAFDRRLAAHDREIAAKALEEAHNDFVAYADSGAPFGHRPVEAFLLNRAAAIRNPEGNGHE